MYREGRHVHKNTRQPAKHIRNNQCFWLKINECSMKKMFAAAFTAKIEKIIVVGPPFSGNARFFSNLVVPGGTQKSWKLAAHFGQKPLKTIDPSKIIRFFDLGVASGSILEYLGGPKGSPGNHFQLFFHLPIIFPTLSTLPPKTPSNSTPSTQPNPKRNPKPSKRERDMNGCLPPKTEKKTSKRGRDINGSLPPKTNKTEQKGEGHKWLPPSTKQQNRTKWGGTWMTTSLQTPTKLSKRGRDINGCLPPKTNKTEQNPCTHTLLHPQSLQALQEVLAECA